LEQRLGPGANDESLMHAGETSNEVVCLLMCSGIGMSMIEADIPGYQFGHLIVLAFALFSYGLFLIFFSL
jgi:hypothetical protein